MAVDERSTKELLERDEELAHLGEALVAARGGAGGVTVVSGPPGIGKTSLLRAARARARELDLGVLAARGSELERDFAFGAVRQLLEPALHAAADPEGLWAGAASLARGVFGTGAAPGGERDASFTTLHGLYWLVSNLADRGPLLLAVDDVHWLDAPSLRFLDYLGLRLEGLPVALVVTMRPSAEEPLSALARDPQVRLVRPAPLSRDAVTALVRARLGERGAEELGEACHTATGGNPFLLGELLAELAREGSPAGAAPDRVAQISPPRVAAAVRARLAALPEPARDLAAAVAVLGRTARLGLAARLAGLDEAEAATAADALAAAGVLDGGRPLRFVHALVGTAVREELSAGDRAAAHARAAVLLREDGAGQEQVALHLLATEPGRDAATVETLREAAERARARGAPDVASRYLRRAVLERPPGADYRALLLERGSAAAAAGESDAPELLRAAFEQAGDPATRAAAGFAYGQALTLGDWSPRAGEVLRAALEAKAQAPDSAPGLEELLLVGLQTSAAARRAAGENLAALLAACDDPGAVLPRGALAVAAMERAGAQGTAAQAIALAARAAPGWTTPEEWTPNAVPLLAVTVAALGTAGALAEAQSLAGDLVTRSQAEGSAQGIVVGTGMRAWIRLLRGDLAGSEVDARTFVELSRACQWVQVAMPLGIGALVETLIERGDLDAAAEAAASVVLDGRDSGRILAARLRYARGRLALAVDDPRGALAETEACRAWEEAWGAANGVWVAWRSLAAMAHARLGDAPRAHELAAKEIALARRFGAARPLGVALRRAGAVAGPVAGRAALEEAVETLAGADAAVEHTRAEIELGAALAAGEDVERGRSLLRAGIERAHALGAARLEQGARTALLASGARPQRVAVSGWAALTPAEQRVAGLAAQGLANREIAQGLFVTAKTVETHLGSAYRKLGIGSRAQLVAHVPPAARERLPPPATR